MKKFYLLIGIPASGKTTYVDNFLKKSDESWVILSTDNLIEQEASRRGLTYSEIFDSYVKTANKLLLENLNQAIIDGSNIIWDQTNVSRKTRKNKIEKIPNDYYKTAVFFNVPDDDTLKKRLTSRPGKVIPYNIVKNMASNLEAPSLEEGFDNIIFVEKSY